MLSIPILARLFGGNGGTKEAQDDFVQELQAKAFKIDPATRYYLLSDFHLEPDGPSDPEPLL